MCWAKNPTPDFNLTTELKNIKGSKKTDGAILKDGKALAVIELKGTNTTDLGKVEEQAFGYKNNQPGAHYVITSNFEKLRFYIDNAVEYEEFNLFKLSKERFELLWLCTSSNYLLKDIPKKIKDESLTQEENITKKLYKDYAAFRNEIFDAIQKENPEYDKLTLFKKTQKLLDRFLFIFFAEDRLLLPPNSIRSIVNQWTDLRDKYDEYFPLYDRFKKYFGYMNTGHKGQQHDIFAYNGGLFAPDEILDNIKINDEILHKHTLTLSNYDFESEVSVNILGHIFEHSLNDIQEIQAEIEGITTDKTKTKRKKDGVFYTPKYITKYIVDTTVGKLCDEKKVALEISEEDYEKDRKGRQKATLKKLSQKLEDYRNWLLQLTICDPACGSGAFLNQALEFLIAEHRYIDELQAKLFGDAMVLNEVENSILENNLYGVDINQESVEIAKLSLWLRTAQKGRKLTSLNNNIKTGNSLIDDPEVAGDKAFHWQTEFPEIFEPKEKQAYHVVLTTHNSRTSQRMIDYKIEKRSAIELSLDEELALTEIIGDIIIDNGYHCLAYNVCKDHVHMVLVCEADDLVNIVQKIKSVSSKLFRRLDIPMGHDPLEHRGFWSQKFFRADMDVWKLNTLSNQPGYTYQDTHLGNAINYIIHNREKHELPASKKLEKIIAGFVVDQDTAFATEYKGGFDVVIGNPPYVRKQGLVEHYPEMTEYYEKKYESATANYDIYALFMEKSYHLINDDGIVSYILPHKFLVTDFGMGIRHFFKARTAVQSILHFGSEMVFTDASTYTCIISLDKSSKDTVYFKKINPTEITNAFDWDHMLYKNLSEQNWDLQSQQVFDVMEKLLTQPYKINDVFTNIFQGIATSLDAVYVFEGIDKGNYIQAYISKYNYHFEIEKELVKPFIKGNEISKYKSLNNKYFVFFPYVNGNAVTEEYIKTYLPKTYAYLKHFEAEIRGREKGKMDIKEGWYLYIYPKSLTKFGSLKIMTQEISLGCNMTYDEKGEFYHPTTIYSFVKNDKFEVDEKFYLGILNSKVMWFFLKNTGTELRGGYFRFKTNYLKPFPLPRIPENPNDIMDNVNIMLSLNKDLQDIENTFLNLLLSKYAITKPSKKLQNWHELEPGEFIKELEKARKKAHKENISRGHDPLGKLSLSEEAEWLQYFAEQRQKALAIKSEIDKTDKEINAMVYDLYGLTKEEIAIIEEATT